MLVEQKLTEQSIEAITKRRNEQNASLINIIHARKADIKRMEDKGVSPGFVDEKKRELEELIDYAAGMDALVEKACQTLMLVNLQAKAQSFIVQELMALDIPMSEYMKAKGINLEVA